MLINTLSANILVAASLMMGLPATAQNVEPVGAGALPSTSTPATPAHRPVSSVMLNNGILVEQFELGTGAKPNPGDTVTVHYRGRFEDGTEFDSSYKRGMPSKFPLNNVIRCWSIGLTQLQEGAKGRLSCPAHVAYGEKGIPGTIPPNATLFFDVELIEVSQ